MTDKQREQIELKLAESRRLGHAADKAGDRVVDALRRAARSSGRARPEYRAVNATRH
jgi:hypothetical protein